MKRKPKLICPLVGSVYKVGDPPPSGYTAWDDWAKVQYNGGLRQVRRQCGRYHFPQEKCRHAEATVGGY